MKKTLTMTIIALLAILSCSKDAVKEVNRGHAIDFRAATQTKGEVIGNDELDSFYATALDSNDELYFENVLFTLTGNYFSSDNKYYWPSDGSALDFYTYSPSLEKLGGAQLEYDTDTEKNVLIGGITISKDIEQQVDFVTATALDKNEANEGVSLTFQHNMSSIGFNASISQDIPSGYEYIVTGVKIYDVMSTGDFNMSESNWQNVTNANTIECQVDEGIILTTTSSVSLLGSDQYAFIIPQSFYNDQTNESLKFGVKLQINFNEEKILDGWVDAEFPVITENDQTKHSWEKGKRYIYNLEFSDPSNYIDPITIRDVEVNWHDASTNSVTIETLIGYWEAVNYTKILENFSEDDNGNPKVTKSYKKNNEYVEWEEETDSYQNITYNAADGENDEGDLNKIAEEIANFHKVEVISDTKMKVYYFNPPRVRQYVFENSRFLIEDFEDPNNKGEYNPAPYLERIDPIKEDGSARYGTLIALEYEDVDINGKVKTRRTERITYKITQINQ